MVVFYDEYAKLIKPMLSAEKIRSVETKLKVDPPYEELNGSILLRKHINYLAQAVGGKIQAGRNKD